MRLGKSFDKANLFNKTTDTSDDITEGGSKLFFLDTERTKVGYLPDGANTYLEIESSATEPGTGTEGDVYYNTTDSKFYLYEDSAWIEVLFSMVEIVP